MQQFSYAGQLIIMAEPIRYLFYPIRNVSEKKYSQILDSLMWVL